MSVSVQLIDSRGRSNYISICLSDTIGKKKKELKQESGVWTYDGGVLKNEKTFGSYEISNNEIIITSQNLEGGIQYLNKFSINLF